MHIKYTLLFFISVFLCQNIVAQDNKQAAFMKIFEAERLFAAEKYSAALSQLNQAEEILDTSNTQLELWKAKTYLKLGEYDNALESAAYYLANERAKESLEYGEMQKLKIEANKAIAEEARQDSLRQVNQVREAENKFWIEVRRRNTVEEYQRYLSAYPNGHYSNLAKNKIKNIKVVSLPGSHLVDAVKRGDYDAVTKMVLKDSVNVNHEVIRKKTKNLRQGDKYEIYHESPLYMAIYKMDFRMIRFLLEQGADPNGVSYSEIIPYKKEVYKRSYLSSLIRLTSKDGIHSNKEEQVVELIRLLSDYGLDANFMNGEPLALAVFYRVKGYKRSTVIRELLRKGADPKAKGFIYKGNSYSALDLAKIRKDDYIKEVLNDKRYKKLRK